ncbi:MAG: FliI/YscN family ATPase [Candidatus Auribacterota bacterium]|jgi:flagellum-specific ATP synthase|nr:FliI/YscN family ATPase [Candidatus Auribacterota bacterium]
MGIAGSGRSITQLKSKFVKYHSALSKVEPVKVKGRIAKLTGLMIEATCPAMNHGDLCSIQSKDGSRSIKAEVVGIKDKRVQIMPLGILTGIAAGDLVNPFGEPLSVPVGIGLLGRVIDGLGNPIDNKGELRFSDRYPVMSQPPCPMSRQRICKPIGSGIRAIDGLLTFGKGQRMGIFAGSGVGKSMLLGMIAKYSEADVNVIALIGERGRELRDFIENSLGAEGLKRSVVIVATSDQPALIRLKGAFLAHAVAEFFRDQGCNVMLMLDSITRFAMAQREIGLSVGEPPASKGYTPSVFSMLPALLERSGQGVNGSGSITGLYTVLVESDDFNEPISDAVRAILDGHIILSRDIASSGHYPAIDVLQSLSRLFTDIVPKEQIAAAINLREVIATYRKAEDLINIGAYVKGSNPAIDYSISMIGKVNDYLKQSYSTYTKFSDNQEQLIAMFNKK